jgi:hypothetical protein
MFEADTIDAVEHESAGPSVVLCLEHGMCGESTAAAIAAAAPYWTPDPNADPTADEWPEVYPLDLAAGSWATVRGVDARGWNFTITGRVMSDPEHVYVEGVAFPNDRVAVHLRTARGVDVELYPREDNRVMVRDVLADAVPKPTRELIPFGMPQPARGRPLATPDSARWLAEAAETAAHHRAAADTAPAHMVDGSTVVAPAGGDAPVIVAHVARIDLTTEPESVAQEDDTRTPFVSGWAQLALPV